MADSTKPEEHEDSNAVFEPVIRLTEQIESKTHEEDEDVIFKLRSKLFRFDTPNSEWKERGTGEVRLLAHKETKKVRVLMRREQTHKVCANHYITSDMRLQPNIGSDRSWVWKVAADISDGEPTAETLAIRFANAENANKFKDAFEAAQKTNAALAGKKEEEAAAAAAETAGDSKDDSDDDSEAADEATKEEKPSETAEGKDAAAEEKKG